MSVPRYTTPTFTLTFAEQGLDLTQATGVYVTFKQALYEVTKTGDDLEVEAKKISICMSQEDTARFFVGDVEMQANWTTGDRRACSEIVSYPISEQLLKQVIE